MICLDEYHPNDDIILLPCNDKHFFHSNCIKDWLKTNNSCPLCKKPITMEDLKKQRTQKRSALPSQQQ